MIEILHISGFDVAKTIFSQIVCCLTGIVMTDRYPLGENELNLEACGIFVTINTYKFDNRSPDRENKVL